MSEKTKNRLQRIWETMSSEPRHFFFWITLISALVFVMVLLITALAGGPPPLIPWVALAAIVGFLLGVPAFVLSWIPPVRRQFTRLLQHKLFVCACFVTLFALFYAVENWRGRTAWNNFRHEWEPRGVKFEMEKIMPPVVPPGENMYEAEPWTGLHFTKSEGGGVALANPEVQNEVWFDCTGPNHREAPEGTDVFLARKVDLKEWQDFYRGTNNQFATADGGLTNYLPISQSPQTPAKDVLLALSKFNPRLDQIRAAAQRPNARFWLNFEDGIGTLFPHLVKFKSIAQHLRLRSTALLADGQTDAAFDDIMLAFRLDHALRDEPLLISHLVRIAILHNTLSAVWEGLADHRWSDAQLTAIEAELARTNVLAEFHNSMNGELYFSMWCVDFMHRTGDLNALNGAAEPGEYSPGDQIMEASGKIVFRLFPRGWFDQNKLSLGRMHVDYIRPQVDPEKQLVLPANSRRTGAAINSLRPTPYDLFSRMLVPALERVAKKSAAAQTYVNFARIACALERYRLANGSYPETLELLEPKFISKLPHDVINGQPLKYRRTASSFVLYSVGWNEKDNDGTVVLTEGKNPRVDQDKGDWVWTYPAE